jgi:redox-sensing transcriptional repressor
VPRRVSDSTVRRISYYLRALEALESDGSETVSSEELAELGGTTAAQVRKDLSQFGSFGKRGLGYDVSELSTRLRRILGLDARWRVAVVGAGRIGSALFEYPNFTARGYDCVAVLDADPGKVGQTWGDVTIRPVEDLERVIRDLRVDLVILAVPPHAAQEVADRAVAAGVRGLMNFASVQLRVPSHVPVTDVNLVMELEALSFAIRQAGSGP